MPRQTVTISEEQKEFIESKVGNGREYDSRSEVVRMCINEYERAEELQEKVERLEREKRMILEQRDDNREIKRYVESEIQYREADLITRAKWFVFGKV